jgi:molybdate transport system substrate-binding protein
MRARLTWIATLCLCLALALPAQAAETLVSAAASLREAFTNAGQAFEKANPGAKITFNFAASGALAAQIEQGAPVDLFVSANQPHLDRLEKAGLLLEGTRRDLIANALVVVQGAKTDLPLAQPVDLLKPEVRHVAVGDPATVPAGQYAKQALVKLGLWDALQPKLVLGADVRQVREYAIRGEVEAGLVFASDALSPQVKVALRLAQDLHDPIVYPAAVLKRSADQAQAKAFLDFLLGSQGQAFLIQAGFAPVPR